MMKENNSVNPPVLGRVLFYLGLFSIGGFVLTILEQILQFNIWSNQAIIFGITTILIFGLVGIVWGRGKDVTSRLMMGAVSIVLAIIALRTSGGIIPAQYFYALVFLIAVIFSQPIFYKKTVNKKALVVRVLFMVAGVIVFTFLFTYVLQVIFNLTSTIN